MAKSPSKLRVYLFIVVLCFCAALLLSIISISLRDRQEKEQINYRNQQLLLSSQILDFSGIFKILKPDDRFTPAVWENPILVPKEYSPKATKTDIYQICELRLRPLLADKDGKVYSFEQAGLKIDTYLAKNEKKGYYRLPYKLFYEIQANVPPDKYTKTKPYGYVFPVNGYGLWDAIYGFIAVKPDANTILGISWYEHKETPGLGGEISKQWWQEQFFGKEIFQKNTDGSINYETAPLGIDIVPGAEMDRLPETRQDSSVDAVTGATMTMQGVQKALRVTLEPYRPLLIKLRNQNGETT